MKTLFFSVIFFMIFSEMRAQSKFYTKAGKITFFSKSFIENIEAVNNTVTCAMDTSTGAIQFALKMKGFGFRKSMMQNHFNESYVESDKFPLSEFRGKITNNNEVNYSKDGTYPAHVKGSLQIHGETNPVDADGTITVAGKTITLQSQFKIMLTDYKIDIPALVKDNISNTIAIAVDCQLQPMNQ